MSSLDLVQVKVRISKPFTTEEAKEGEEEDITYAVEFLGQE